MLKPAIFSHQPNDFSVLEVFVRFEQVCRGNRQNALVFSQKCRQGFDFSINCLCGDQFRFFCGQAEQIQNLAYVCFSKDQNQRCFALSNTFICLGGVDKYEIILKLNNHFSFTDVLYHITLSQQIFHVDVYKLRKDLFSEQFLRVCLGLGSEEGRFRGQHFHLPSVDQTPNIRKLLPFCFSSTGAEPFLHKNFLFSFTLSQYFGIVVQVSQFILDLSGGDHINIIAETLLFDAIVHFVALFMPSAQQYMISNKQGRPFLPNCHRLPSPPKNGKDPTFEPSQQASGGLFGVLSLLASKRYGQAYSESGKLKMPLLQELIRVAYEHSLIRYLLLTRDKIVQVNPEQHLLTESGMQSLRTAGMYREESMQARANYAVIAENIRKLVNAGNFFQCTLPNKQEMLEVKTALSQLFQEMKNRQRQPLSQTQTYASSQATNCEKEQNMAVSQFKEGLLEIISLVMPTQTLKTNANREKTLGELVIMAKDQIKEAFQGFKNELELVQSRAQFCERSLESERVTKIEKERQLRELQMELISSQKYIEDLQGLKAATQMENLGLHSKIRSSQCKDSEENYQDEIQRLNLQNEQLKEQMKQLQDRLYMLKEELQENRNEAQRMNNQMNTKLERVAIEAQEQKQKLEMLLQEQKSKKAQLQSMMKQKQSQILKMEKEAEHNSLEKASLLQKISAIKFEKDNIESEFQRLQSLHQRCEDYPQEISKLQQELECLHSQHIHILQSLKQQQEKRSASQLLADQLQKMLEQGQQQKTNLQQQIEILSGDRQNYAGVIRDLQEKMRQLQEQNQYITAKKDHYQNISSPCERDDKCVQTAITLQDLRMIQQSLAGIAQRQQELQQLHNQNQILKSKLYSTEWAGQHA